MIISLIGYRATGKTTVAQRLATRLGCEWIDTDVEVELVAGKSIREIFAAEGESAFRNQETKVLEQLVARDNLVLATGGGMILRERNRRLLKLAGPTIWLTARPRTLYDRIHGDESSAERRPNLTADGGLTEIEQVLAAREPLYRECADQIVDTERSTPAEIVETIWRLLNLPTDAAEPSS